MQKRKKNIGGVYKKISGVYIAKAKLIFLKSLICIMKEKHFLLYTRRVNALIAELRRTRPTDIYHRDHLYSMYHRLLGIKKYLINRYTADLYTVEEKN